MTRNFFPDNGFTVTERLDGETRFEIRADRGRRPSIGSDLRGATSGVFRMSENVEAALERIFRSVLRVPPGEDVSSLSAESHGWDSVAHLNLILAVEQEFRFMMTPEEASAANSFQGDAGPGEQSAMRAVSTGHGRGVFALRFDVDSVTCLEQRGPRPAGTGRAPRRAVHLLRQHGPQLQLATHGRPHTRVEARPGDDAKTPAPRPRKSCRQRRSWDGPAC